METKIDYAAQSAYREMESDLRSIVGGEEAVIGIIWIEMMDWIEPKGDALEKELFQFLTQLLGEDRLTWGFLNEEMRKWQEEIKKQFAFGKSCHEMGDTWNNFVIEDDCDRLNKLLDVLTVYLKHVLPYVYRAISDFWGEKYIGKEGEHRMTILRESYRDQRRKINEQINFIRTVVDILELKQRGRLPASEII